MYLRISDDQEGLALGVKRQEEDCRALAERAGATVAGVYTDNDVGASTRSRSKVRKEFDHLVADVRSGRINTIIFHSSSRLTRRPLEYEGIIQLVEQTGVRLLSVASGNVDLTTADGRLIGRMIAAIDAAESERISERVKRALKQRREDGKGHGGNVMTGWLVPDTSKGIGYCTHLDPVAAKYIEDAADWLLSGVTVTQVTNRWNNAEFTTVRGRAWTIATVQALLSSPRLAGLVELDGEIIGRGITGRESWTLSRGTTFSLASSRRGIERLVTRHAGISFQASSRAACAAETCVLTHGEILHGTRA